MLKVNKIHIKFFVFLKKLAFNMGQLSCWKFLDQMDLWLWDLQEIQGQRWHLLIVETSSSRFEDLNSRKKKNNNNNNNNNMRIWFWRYSWNSLRKPSLICHCLPLLSSCFANITNGLDIWILLTKILPHMSLFSTSLRMLC